jgi:peroxiredoxin
MVPITSFRHALASIQPHGTFSGGLWEIYLTPLRFVRNDRRAIFRQVLKILLVGDSFNSEEVWYMKKFFLKGLQFLIYLLCAFPCYAVYGSQDQPLPAGSQLPPFSLPAPDSQQTASYLGLSTMEPYTISQIDAKLVLIEILSALCPECHTNAPVLNRLYQSIQKDAALARDVKIIGICIGNDQTQMDAFKKSFKVPFPLVSDKNFAIAQAVEVMHTPTMVLVTGSAEVLWSHSGAIQDFDGLLKVLRENHKKL